MKIILTTEQLHAYAQSLIASLGQKEKVIRMYWDRAFENHREGKKTITYQEVADDFLIDWFNQNNIECKPHDEIFGSYEVSFPVEFSKIALWHNLQQNKGE